MLNAWRLWVVCAIENLGLFDLHVLRIRAMRRGCQGDTIEMPAEYDRVSALVKLNRTSCVPAITQVPGPGTARSRGQRPTQRHARAR